MKKAHLCKTAVGLSKTAQRKTRGLKKIKAPRVESVALEGLEPMHPYAAGIDVGSTLNWVCVPAHALKAGEPTVRSFGVFTVEQDALVEWLKTCQIPTVAMERFPDARAT